MNDLKVRSMSLADVQLALDWAALEGWNPGLEDAIAFYAADPAGFLKAEINGEMIGCISAVCYDRTFAFIGLYIVKPEWRKRGYGQQIWQAAWQQLSTRLEPSQHWIGLDGVVDREATCCRLEFIPAYRHVRHVYQASSHAQGSAPVPSDEVTPLINVPFSELVRYDAELFLASRPHFLKPWISVRGGAAYGVLSSDRLVEYGVLRPCRQGFKIGALFADHVDIADCIFRALIGHVADQPVFIDLPDVNPAIASLIQKYRLQPVFTCVRMYHGRIPDVESDRIFGVTSLELG
ncbi:GNAT family N-acetyltransferase [Phormidesmis sp. 146-12]